MQLTFHRLLRSQPPLCAPCDDQEVRGDAAVDLYEIDSALGRWGLVPLSEEAKEEVVVFTQYEIKDRGCFNPDVWKRVLFRNDVVWSTGRLRPPWAKPRERSLLGRTGHLERANAWTHIAGGVAYLAYAAARPFTLLGSADGLSDGLAYAALAAYALTFFMSATYHVYSANYVMSAITRVGDYAGIYAALAAGTQADVSLTSKNLELASWQSVADAWIGATVLVAFFAYRRTQTPIHRTRRPYMRSKCALGLARSTNVDLEHSGFRAAAGLAMTLSWMQVVPAAFSTLDLRSAWVLGSSRLVGTVLLVLGMLLDNVVLYPDNFELDEAAAPFACTRRCGCICSSHAIFHSIAMASMFVTTFGSEYALAQCRTD